MYKQSPQELSFSAKHKRLLWRLTVDENGPGTILVLHSRNFQGIVLCFSVEGLCDENVEATA